jgi:hypothetical protein
MFRCMKGVMTLFDPCGLLSFLLLLVVIYFKVQGQNPEVICFEKLMYNIFMSVLLSFNNSHHLGRELLLCEKPFICYNTNSLIFF